MKALIAASVMLLADMAGPCAGHHPNRVEVDQVDVTCAGVGCGKTGTLYAVSCSNGTSVQLGVLGVVTLAADQSYDLNLSNFAPGECVSTFLDVAGTGVLAAGDVVDSAGNQVLQCGGLSCFANPVLDQILP